MSIYSRYEDALIAKLRIYEWYQTYEGKEYLLWFFDSMNSKHDPEDRLDSEGLVHIQTQMIERADPIYVSMDIADIVDEARWSWKVEKLLPSDPFVPYGFAVFPKPIMLDDAPIDDKFPGRYKEGVPVRAISWMPLHSENYSVGCYWIAFYTHIDDESQEKWDKGEAQGIRSRFPLSMGHQWQWTWGANPLEGSALIYEGETEEQGAYRSQQQASLVQTFWRLGQQFITTKERAPRGLWRAAQRKGLPDRDITVMLLRRAHDRYEGEPTGRQMKVRSITRGHWRNQYYRSIGEHRQIWIDPYLRGPEGAPLINPQRAIEFRR